MVAWQLVLTLVVFSSPALGVRVDVRTSHGISTDATTIYRLGAPGRRFVCMHPGCCLSFASGASCREHARSKHRDWLEGFGRALGGVLSGPADWYEVMDTEAADELKSLSTEELAKAKIQAEKAQAKANEKAQAKADEKASGKAAKKKAKAENKAAAKAERQASKAAETAAAQAAKKVAEAAICAANSAAAWRTAAIDCSRLQREDVAKEEQCEARAAVLLALAQQGRWHELWLQVQQLVREKMPSAANDTVRRMQDAAGPMVDAVIEMAIAATAPVPATTGTTTATVIATPAAAESTAPVTLVEQ